MDYSTLNRAQLSFDYLHANSTTHEFLFGALAELLDNARDASATKMDIFTINDPSLRGGYILCFMDDGEGMDPAETASVVTFGKSTKKLDDLHKIGMYGNGLKSGSMRIGNDLMLFTKKADTRSVLFLSRSFHEEENLDEVIVPIPSFEADSHRPLAADTRAKAKHEIEMEIILKYSPFKTMDDFFCQFDRLDGQSGTLVMVYNLKLLDSGEPELNVLSDPYDIILANPNTHDFDSDEGLMPERKSFRAYAAILYMDPRMRIYIQNKKVRTKRLACTLYKSKMYKYSSNRFKTRAENEAKKAIDEALAAENKAREAESKAKNLENRTGSSLNKEQRMTIRKAQNYAAECRGQAQVKRQMAERKTKSLKEPKTLSFIFGLNIENRSHDGVFVYNCSRLIKMYQKVGPQSEGGIFCCGIVGIVDVPYLVLEPTHNKQDFADAKEFRHLMRAMGEHMMQYWKDTGITQQGVAKFWESFGYSEGKDLPSDDIKFAQKRAMQLNVTLQCDMCLKWRMIPFNSNNVGKEFPDHWVCTMNLDPQYNTCSAAEQKLNIPEGVLKKEIKSQEQKRKDLEEEILRKTEMLEKLQKMKVVQSTREVSVLLNKDDSFIENQLNMRGVRDSSSSSSLGSQKMKVVPSTREVSVLLKKDDSFIENQLNMRGKAKAKSPSPPPSPEPPKSRSSGPQTNCSVKKPSRSSRSPSPPSRANLRSSTSKPSEKIGKPARSPSPPPETMAAKRARIEPKPAAKQETRRRILEPAQSSSGEEEGEGGDDEEREEPKDRRGRSQNSIENIAKKDMKRTLAKEQIEPKPAARQETRRRILEPAQSSSGEENEGNEADDDEEREEPKARRGRSQNSIDHSANKDMKRTLAKEQVIEHTEIPVKKQRISHLSTENNNKHASPATVDTSSDRVTRAPGRRRHEHFEAVLNENEAQPVELRDTKDANNKDVIGCRVTAQVNSKWYPGVVIQVNSKGKWKVKFDHHPKDKYDKWFQSTGSDIRLSESNEDSRVRPASSPASQDAGEAPTSSTVTPTVSSQIMEDIANGYRTCLRYFLPPQWIMDKDAITTMSLQELSDFPLDDFFDNYEQGLRRLVSNFQTEAALKKDECEEAREKLISIRKLIAKLLKTTNEGFDIDPEESGDQVDELLEACVRQATLQAS